MTNLFWFVRDNWNIGFVSAFFWYSASSKIIQSQKNSFSEPTPFQLPLIP